MKRGLPFSNPSSFLNLDFSPITITVGSTSTAQWYCFMAQCAPLTSDYQGHAAYFERCQRPCLCIFIFGSLPVELQSCRVRHLHRALGQLSRTSLRDLSLHVWPFYFICTEKGFFVLLFLFFLCTSDVARCFLRIKIFQITVKRKLCATRVFNCC